tara:strand:- start:440 stop:670 length:231 start_codon:yes stop_codon:yes gene_type:complete
MIGKLSALVRITLKFSSRKPTAKKNVITTMDMAQPVFVHNKCNLSLRFILSNQSVGGNNRGVSTVKSEKLIVGLDI